MKKHTLSAEKREITGRKVKTLRKEGLIPANVFGKNIKSEAIQIKAKSFEEVFKDAGETGLIEIAVGKDSHTVLISNMQKDPVLDSVLHVDFRQVNLKEKITANVPVEVEGESPAEKSGLGTAVQQLQEIEIEALPTDIPEKFVINIDNLTEVDQAIFIKDVKAPEGVEIITDGEQIVVKVEPLQKEEVIEEAPATTEEGATPEAQAPAEETPQSES